MKCTSGGFFPASSKPVKGIEVNLPLKNEKYMRTVAERVFGESKYFTETIEKYLISTLTKMLIIIRHFLIEGALLGLKPIFTLWMCRASVHSFFIDCQSLRELRITGVLIIATTQKKCG
jgi:hypothetical protein